MIHDEPHRMAGKTVKLSSGEKYVIEDWADRVLGQSVWAADGNPAAIEYAVHRYIDGLPIDDNVLYGKIGWLGHIRHVSEIVDPGLE